ncbi:MAG: cysteine dioxygenase [Nocardiopsaceae bacterium]|nr:cysteine dioxygenase [Nocardiopsaceae bacterium]
MTITREDVLSPARLAERVRRMTESPAEWIARVRLDPDGRWYEQIHVDDSYEIWLISWLPGQSTGFHDHGGASGAFAVVWGDLHECVVPQPAPDPAASADRGPRPHDRTGTVAADTLVKRVSAGVVRSFGPRYVHDVRNTSDSSVAVSVHAYSPPLSEMTRYNLTPGGLVAVGTEGETDW